MIFSVAGSDFLWCFISDELRTMNISAYSFFYVLA